MIEGCNRLTPPSSPPPPSPASTKELSVNRAKEIGHPSWFFSKAGGIEFDFRTPISFIEKSSNHFKDFHKTKASDKFLCRTDFNVKRSYEFNV